MSYQAIFQRHELKYMLSQTQKQQMLEAIQSHMELNQYGRTTIQNIYFDTDSYWLIRRSIEKPAYKEKLRIRRYANERGDKVFVELKKKYNKIVYKRRMSMREDDAMKWLNGEKKCDIDSQIAREIDYFLQYYENLHPSLFLSYEREAYYSKERNDFRITFDENVMCRQQNVSFQEDGACIPILDADQVLMEIKCVGGMPMWMAEILSREKIYKTSFSKYGTAYQKIIFPEWKGVQK